MGEGSLIKRIEHFSDCPISLEMCFHDHTFKVHPEVDERGIRVQGASWLIITANLPRLQQSERQVSTYSIERGFLVFMDQLTVKNARISTCILKFLISAASCTIFLLLTWSLRKKAYTDDGKSQGTNCLNVIVI